MISIIYNIFYSIYYEILKLYLIELCKYGMINKIKHYYKNNSIKEEDHILFLNIACNKGYLNIAKWLYDYKKINLHADNYILKNACFNGNLNILKWLLLLDTFDIHVDNNYCFRMSIRNEKFEVAKYLHFITYRTYNMIPLDFCEIIQFEFFGACTSNKLSKAKFLYSLDSSINFRRFSDYAFYNACHLSNHDIVYFLGSLCDEYYYTVSIDGIRDYGVKNNLHDLQYLYYNNEYDKIINKLGINKKEDFILDGNKNCTICFSEDYNFITSCNHTFCLNCFLTWYIKYNREECSYCRQNINIEHCFIKS